MIRTVIAVMAVVWPWPASGQQQSGSGSAARCRGALGAPEVLACALAVSPEVAEARQRLAAVAGRRVAARVWLPSNPVVAATLGQRRRGVPEDVSALNWSVTLSQELEIGGQRGARLEVVDAEAASAVRRVAIAEQEVGAAALGAFFETVAAKEAVRLGAALGETGKALAAVAQARAREALIAGVEADVARAEAARLGLLDLEAQRRYAESRAVLSALIGTGAEVVVANLGEVVTPDVAIPTDASVLDRDALRLRGEVGVAEMQRRVLERRLVVLERERIPNVTVSGFAERDEINDRVLGVGLSIPLPLPGPIGQSRAGEIQETIAEIKVADASLALVRRRVQLDVHRAVAAYRSRLAASELFPADLVTRAQADLTALREAFASRQLPLRDALGWQRSLIELLQGAIDTWRERALAAIELRRVVGLPLLETGGAR
jgi:outer membrane protein, heavy metal efflux system